jgi:hypothetical protein
MLRWLAVFAILITCLPIHGQEKSSKSTTDQSKSKGGEQKTSEPISISIVNDVDQHASQRKGDNPDNHSDAYFHHLILPETLASIGLLLVGIAGTYIALRSLKNIERQTKAGEIAANAAFSNAQAVILSERAKMVAHVEEFAGRSFLVQGWNIGRVTAKIRLIRGYTKILPYGQKLPPVPPYLSDPPFNRDYVEWVPPNKFIDIFPDTDDYRLIADLSSDELHADIKSQRRVLWVYGRICYEDGILPEPRETRFCYETALDGKLAATKRRKSR